MRERSSGSSHSPLPKYLLLQLPGIVIVFGALWLLWPMSGLPAWMGAAAAAAWVIKDLALYPLVRGAYEARVPTGAARLVGACGVTRERIEPGRRGYVDVRGERWRARPAEGAAAIEAGTRVVVEDSAGLELTVVVVKD